MRMVIVLVLLCLPVVSNADVLPAEATVGAEQQARKEASATAVVEKSPAAINEHVYVDPNVYPCTPGELKLIKANVIQIAGSRNPENAWQVVNTMLCREDVAAGRFILKHMPKTIVFVNSELDEVDTERGEASPDLLLKKYEAEGLKVSDVSVNEDGMDITISYTLVPSCIGSFWMKFNGRAWLITKISEGCC